MSDPIAAGRAR